MMASAQCCTALGDNEGVQALIRPTAPVSSHGALLDELRGWSCDPLAALIYVAVRLSLAPALTFESRRINLLGSWALTRGRFWPLLGAYVLTVALVAMVWILSQLVVLALGVVLSGGDMQAATLQPDMSSLRAYFTPYRMIQTVLSAGVSALVWPVLFTPPVAIYRSLAPAGLTAAVPAGNRQQGR